jgi:thiamine biosynthesis protein ThiC
MKSSPRYAYFDLNHFINLAKDIKNNNGQELEQLKKKVSNGEIVIPMSAEHFTEILSIGKVEQRRVLLSIVQR